MYSSYGNHGSVGSSSRRYYQHDYASSWNQIDSGSGVSKQNNSYGYGHSSNAPLHSANYSSIGGCRGSNYSNHVIRPESTTNYHSNSSVNNVFSYSGKNLELARKLTSRDTHEHDLTSDYFSSSNSSIPSTPTDRVINGQRRTLLTKCLPKPIVSTCSNILSRFSHIDKPQHRNYPLGGTYSKTSSSITSNYASSRSNVPSSFTSASTKSTKQRLLLPSGSLLSLSSDSSDDYVHMLPPVYPKTSSSTRYHFRYPFSVHTSTGTGRSYATSQVGPSVSRLHSVHYSKYNSSSAIGKGSSYLPTPTPYRSYLTCKKSVSRHFTRCDFSHYSSNALNRHYANDSGSDGLENGTLSV